ncbi:type 2 periplasmic-binding domain-containing protein [Listeria welshimeri]|uniref:hypothetical protein n=1 Tax=Listeria welshimeri TaxID=1643 RepID=UPI001886FED4|nr:hypothetical protein [Listeria welshimeri]MBF2483833.1 hypothetical protein [Listeria welshimeri]
MKKIKVLLLALVFCLVFSACSLEKNSDSLGGLHQKIQSKETIITFPDEEKEILDTLFDRSTNSITALLNNKDSKSLSLRSYDMNQQKWGDELSITFKDISNKNGKIQNAIFLDDGNIILDYFVEEDGSNPEGKIDRYLYLMNRDSNLTTEISSEVDLGFIILGSDQQGSYYSVDEVGQVFKNKFLENSEEYGNVDTSQLGNYYFSDKANYLLDQEGLSELNTKKDSYAYKSINNSLINSNINTVNSEYSIFQEGDKWELVIGNSDGLFRSTKNGMELVMDGSHSLFGDSNHHIQSIEMIDKDNIVVFFNGTQNLVMAIYTITEEPLVYKNDLRIYSLFENEMLKQVVNQYNREHPDINVEIEIGIPAPPQNGLQYDQELDQAIKKLKNNSDIDVVMLDGIQIDSLLKEYKLKELKSLIEVDKESYYMNIIEAYNFETGMYGIPTSFSFPVIASNQNNDINKGDVLDHIERVVSSKDDSYLNGEGIREVTTESLYNYHFTNGNITREAINKYFTELNEFKKIYEKNVHEDDKDSHSSTVELVGAIKPYLYIGVLDNLIGNNTELAVDTISTMVDLRSLVAAKQLGNHSELLKYEDQAIFQARNIMGVSNESDDVDLSINFIEYVLGKDVQVSYQHSLPVNREAMHEKITTFNPVKYFSKIDANQFKMTLLSDINDKEEKELIDKIERLNIPIINDSYFKSTIYELSEELLKGEINKETAIERSLKEVGI